MHNPFARPKPNPKREKERRVRGRVRLRGEDMTELRRQAFERSGGRCEVLKGDPIVVVQTQEGPMAIHFRCNRPITWETMELSHDRHAANKSDTLETVKASCKECHQVGKHNPKPCNRKPGRRMNQTEALAYWNGDVCFCGETKGKRWSFCFDCLQKLSPQVRDDLEKVIGKDYLETMAAAEVEILAWKPEEERTAS